MIVDLRDDDDHAEKLLMVLDAYIHKWYGKRCPQRQAGCRLCEIWALYDLIDMMIGNDSE